MFDFYVISLFSSCFFNDFMLTKILPNHERINTCELISHCFMSHSVQFSHSVVSDSLRPHGLQHTRPPCPSPPPKLAQTRVHWVGDASQPFNPLSFPSPPPSIFPSIRVFSEKSALRIRWPKYWSFNFSISPSDEYSGLISFRIDWLDLLEIPWVIREVHLGMQCVHSSSRWTVWILTLTFTGWVTLGGMSISLSLMWW